MVLANRPGRGNIPLGVASSSHASPAVPCSEGHAQRQPAEHGALPGRLPLVTLVLQSCKPRFRKLLCFGTVGVVEGLRNDFLFQMRTNRQLCKSQKR